MSARNILMAAGGSADDKLYVDDVFSAYTYTGNDFTQTINNGIDLAGKGGLVWARARDSASGGHFLSDTDRGINNVLSSNSTSGNSAATYYTGITSSGFGLSSNAVLNGTGGAGFGASFISWTFRKSPKFFDVVTYTGNGANRTIAHALGQEVGLIFVKRIDSPSDWQVYHRSLANTEYMVLNSTAVKATGTTRWNSTTATTSNISLGADATVNASGGAYVAYLFAHDPSADGIVQCGSFTTDGSGKAMVNLGWEPQFSIFKTTEVAEFWRMDDVMRGNPVIGWSGNQLQANSSGAEYSALEQLHPTATGFEIDFVSTGAYANKTFIYLAIRRPNKPPTTGTQVYNAIARTMASTSSTVTGVGFAPDFVVEKTRDSWGLSMVHDRLRGGAKRLIPSEDTEEGINSTYGLLSFGMDGAVFGDGYVHPVVDHFFRRAPGFFDVVCYTGNYTGSNAPLIPHNLGVKPELLIQKKRSGSLAFEWYVLSDTVLGTGVSRYSILNGTSAFQGVSGFLAPTSAGFPASQAADPCVAYLFASLPGISKVGSYTGNGTTQTINCGFTTGARFILIKKTSGTGDWLVADTARGIVSAGDPRLSLNTTAAEVTGEDWLDPDATGFIINQTTADANASGASYIYFSVA